MKYISRFSGVGGFIHARSEALSMALINGEAKPIVLMDIDSYKWTKKNTNAAAKFRRRQRQEIKTSSANVEIKARSLTASSDWSKVK